MGPGSWLTIRPYLAPLALLAALAAFSWRRRAVPGARPFAAACLLASQRPRREPQQQQPDELQQPPECPRAPRPPGSQ